MLTFSLVPKSAKKDESEWRKAHVRYTTDIEQLTGYLVGYCVGNKVGSSVVIVGS